VLRKLNAVADELSKQTLSLQEGTFFEYDYNKGGLQNIMEVRYP